MHGRRVQPGLDHGRHVADLVVEALGEGAGLVVHVPVERVGDDQALGCLGAERMGVGDLLQQRDHLLAALGDAEFRRLLQRVGGVAAGIGERHDLGLGGLRLQQEGGEVRRVERMADDRRAPCRRFP